MKLLQQMPISQYFPGDSIIHRFDPRAKLLFVFLFGILAFAAKEISTYSLLIATLGIGIVLSRVSVSYLWRGIRPILWLILLTVFIHLFMTKGGAVLYAWKFIEIHEEGMRQALQVSIRLLLLISVAMLLTLTTSPIDLTDGIERLLQPLVRFRFPAHELAMMMSIALRFVPTLMEETNKIINAQTSRGADFESSNIIKRAKCMLPLLIPLFVSAFRRAEELALAMEARGYQGGIGRTKFRELRWAKVDMVLLACSIVILVLFIVCKRWV